VNNLGCLPLIRLPYAKCIFKALYAVGETAIGPQRKFIRSYSFDRKGLLDRICLKTDCSFFR